MRCRLVIRELDVLHLLRKQLHAQVLVCQNVVQAIVAAGLGHNLQNQVWFCSWLPCWAPLAFYPMVDHRIKHEGSPTRNPRTEPNMFQKATN